jgi:hypothetical protein|tara:strand:- start:519 stop:1136 length:618 start_codon:yes stop_codon:yes gene_type:complete
MGRSAKSKQIITNYSKGVIKQENIIKDYGEEYFLLLKMYINDKNSSTLREMITCDIAGYEQNEEKLGYDTKEGCIEIKPKNVTSDSKSKLNGGGNYSDLTHRRHQKYITDDVTIYTSGFVDGFLMYTIEIPYKMLDQHFQNGLDKNLPNGDEKGRYWRSASFALNHYINFDSVSVKFLRKDITDYKRFINKNLYKFLLETKKDGE